MDTKLISINDYDYDLPDHRIAKFPLSRRDQSKLLVYEHGNITTDVFCQLPNHLPAGALMVFNNTKVIRARLHFRKSTGALIEVFLLEPANPTDYEQVFQTTGRCSWFCLVGNLKKWKEGTLHKTISCKGTTVTLGVTRGEPHGIGHTIDFSWDNSTLTFADILEADGQLPIPPYLHRQTQESDNTTYQTVYSKTKGSVAAPTAGLHFTPELLQRIDQAGIHREELTLHVGAGTFKPVKSQQMAGHEMHTEFISVSRHTIERLLSHDCRAIAVGTTSVRTLESLYYMGLRLETNMQATPQQLYVEQWEPYECLSKVSARQALENILAWMDCNQTDVLHASTQIIIAPGYQFHYVDSVVTNFHQPKSTLLLLVAALVGERWRDIYRYALDNDFRFLSYGDASLIIP